MLSHNDFHYSVTVQTDDLAMVHCLRGLSMFAQAEGNKRIPWGGTKENDWEQHHHCVTFHFSSPRYRSEFEEQVTRLLPKDSWTRVGDSDENPAKPQDGHESWL